MSLRRYVGLAVLASWVPLMASDYLTEGKDPGRTGWMKDEKVFTLSNVWVGGGLNPYSERRIPNSRHATIYALDGQTGKELWSSGNQITSWNHWSGLTIANGRAYLGTFDGTMYSFGVPAAAGK